MADRRRDDSLASGFAGFARPNERESTVAAWKNESNSIRDLRDAASPSPSPRQAPFAGQNASPPRKIGFIDRHVTRRGRERREADNAFARRS